MKSLVSDARRAMRNGGDEETGFRTEILCQRVQNLDAALDPAGWEAGHVPGTLDGLRGGLAAVLDMSPDNARISLAVAAKLADGRVRGEVVASWESTAAMRRELPDLLARIRPRMFGWFPAGPAAALAAKLTTLPKSIPTEEIRGEVSSVCMGLADLVATGGFLHSGQEVLTAQALATGKLWNGDTWRFARKGKGHCEAVYAVAGAVHLAQTLPPPIGVPRLVVSS